jgi:ABC-type sugar transport system ATPase subunit
MSTGNVKADDLSNITKPIVFIRDENFIPCIEMKEINYAFGEGESYNQVLFDINLTVYPGEIVILTGPSGSGKTTMLTLIGALRSIQEGFRRLARVSALFFKPKIFLSH